MIDAFLVYFLVSLVPIALIGTGGRTEHALFLGWRWLQVATLFAAMGYLVYRTIRNGWRDFVVMLAFALALAYLALSYAQVAWDAQMEYHRVVMLADRYGDLTEAYRHGITSWILGYPPGTSLSVMFYRTLRMSSVNIAQSILALMWCMSFMQRHMRDVDLAGKLVFCAFLLIGEGAAWHFTFFYNNLFYALIWAELIVVPLLGSSLRPWERCGYALVIVWLRPQWEMAAIPIGLAALSTVLGARQPDRRFVRDTLLTTMAALCIAWLGSGYWRTATSYLDTAMAQEKAQVLDAIAAEQDHHVLTVEVPTKAVEEQHAPVPPLLSSASVEAIKWAFSVSYHAYPKSAWVLFAAALYALILLRRRGLAFLIPLLSPLALIAGTAVFATRYPAYRANTWALERLQVVTPFLSAGVLAALLRAVKQRRSA